MPLDVSPPSVQPPSVWHGQAALSASILVACLLGIYSRPLGFMAAFWPANAILLGLLLRHPELARRPGSWLCALLAYVAADLLTGSTLFTALTLNLANLIGVLAGWLFLARVRNQVLGFKHQRSVMTVFLACLLASVVCTLAGAWPSAIAFHLPLWQSALLWLSAEFYNYVLILPVFLAAPSGWPWTWQLPKQQHSWNDALPLLALILSEAFSQLIGGHGAMAFSMPAMVWCAMSYGVFPITVLSLLVCLWKTGLLAVSSFDFVPEHLDDVLSYRTGLAMLSLAPLAVACAYTLRMQALQKLHHAVHHDSLTGVLARSALLERGQKLLSRLEEEGQSVAVLMLDLDHFKQVNDHYGHAQGDVVLQTFAQLASEALRPDDLLGRLGGEEFAILLPRTQREQALAVGQRICERLRDYRFPLEDGAPFQVTLSIGLHAVMSIGKQDSIEQLLSKADAALYLAKRSGRNQVRQYGPELAPSSI
ncbi:GGDEF domain-containing protein [Comamonas jiangduensis]|uniref:GGDEF domain-containing protein n=1 Tax=Comamonas jiangduensis TaxID=1194168 RepID=UPI0028ABEEA0|nr:diguanylate cyclase [Comamonas jiangduensis]